MSNARTERQDEEETRRSKNQRRRHPEANEVCASWTPTANPNARRHNQEKLLGRHPRETHRERTEEEERVRERGWDEHVVLAEETDGCREN